MVSISQTMDILQPVFQEKQQVIVLINNGK